MCVSYELFLADDESQGCFFGQKNRLVFIFSWFSFCWLPQARELSSQLTAPDFGFKKEKLVENSTLGPTSPPSLEKILKQDWVAFMSQPY